MRRVILVNLGGPRNLDEIQKFLTDLFTDPYIFDLPLPEFLRLFLGKYIAKKRVTKIRHSYESLNYGGGSPLVDETIKQAKKLEERLKQLSKENWQVEVGMVCGFPNLRNIRIEKDELGKTICILPLYPQYSRSTTLSAIKIVQSSIDICPITRYNSCSKTLCAEQCKIANLETAGWINPFYKDPEFIDTSVSLILDFFEGRLCKNDFIELEEFPQEDWKNIPILFSAHGIPIRLVRKGDPYPEQIEETRKLIELKLRQKGFQAETFLAYQSKVGPAKWTEPSTLEMLEKLGKKGLKVIAVYPISFVSDHLETLEEIGNQLRVHARKHGIEKYYRIPAFGTYPKFIEFLAHLILRNLKFQIVQPQVVS